MSPVIRQPGRPRKPGPYPNPYVKVRLWERLSPCQGARTYIATPLLLAFLLLLPLFLATVSCGHFAAVGRGGPVYAITVDTVNGRKTADRGPLSYPACAIQVGDRMARVWMAHDSRGDDVVSPVVLQADAVALKAGILVERTWSQAVVHKVTDQELEAGAAVVYVPGLPRPTVVELRFDRVGLVPTPSVESRSGGSVTTAGR